MGDGIKRYDRYKDELTPKSIIVHRWMLEEPLMDQELCRWTIQFRLNQGINNIRITLNEGNIFLGRIKIQNIKISVPDYKGYLESLNNSTEVNNKLDTYEAEKLTYKSRQGIRTKYHRESYVTPYSYKNRLLNIIDGDSFNSAGDSVTYKFEVTETGLYKIAFKYMTLGNSGLPSFRTILIDGELKI